MMSQLRVIIVLLLHICILKLLVAQEIERPLVTTQNGVVAGTTKYMPWGDAYDEYLGMRFAAPPTGERRWKKPDPLISWEGTYYATSFKPFCPQVIARMYKFLGMNTKTSEDCLYINVYVPKNLNRTEPIPVMFFIYGGAFIFGTGDMYPGEELSVRAQVIVVTFNYRVGTVGFMSSHSSAAPGNYGLWDQAAALTWTSQNIAAFGGDPSRITIFGQSAGAASVSHLSLSPYTRNLFQRMIAKSGSATSYFGYTHGSEQTFKDLAFATLCGRLNQDSMVNCMRDRHPMVLDFIGVATALVLGKRIPNFVPVLDSDFVYLEPRRALTAGYSSHLDMMMGNTDQDAAFIVYVNPIGLPIGNLLNIAKTKKKKVPTATLR